MKGRRWMGRQKGEHRMGQLSVHPAVVECSLVVFMLLVNPTLAQFSLKGHRWQGQDADLT